MFISVDGFVLPVDKKILKMSHLTYLSQDGASRICLIYQVICFHKDGDLEEYAQTGHKALNQILLVQKYEGAIPNTFYGLKAYSTRKAVTCLKISKMFHY